MNLRISLSLVIVAAWVAVGAVFVFESDPGEEKRADLPFFYTLAPDDIRTIGIDTHNGETEFVLRPEERIWYFADRENIPVSHNRFGGMTFLLGGPKIKRVLQDSVTNDSQFGLDDPRLVVDLTLRDGSAVAMELGNLTPDGESQYARMVGFPQMVLVDSSWGEVITRLVDEPPVPEWQYTLDVNKVNEILFFEGNEVIRGIAFHEDQGWIECDIPISGDQVPCTGSTPINEDDLQPWLEHIADPQFRGVARVARTLEASSAELFGITDASPYMDIRYQERRQAGVIDVNHVTIALGDENPDGQGMYVRANEQFDIAEVDLQWGRKLLEFFEEKSFVSN